jgi:hypothetical protein
MLLHKLAEARQAKYSNTKDNKTEDAFSRISKLVESVEVPGLERSGDEVEYVFNTVDHIVKTYNKINKCSATISKYEQDLAKMFSKDIAGSDDLKPTENLLKRAYLMLTEADRQYRYQTKRLTELEEIAESKTFEVRKLRARLGEIETTCFRKEISILHERAVSEVGKDAEKRSALETLIEGYEKSESRRKSLELEIVKLQSRLSQQNGKLTQQNDASIPGNLFIEIGELREMVKEIIGNVFTVVPKQLSESVPRLVPPTPSETTQVVHQYVKSPSMEDVTSDLFLEDPYM